ncbi:MAG: thermonuclease family protein [Planctomycetaceae bacterium]
MPPTESDRRPRARAWRSVFMVAVVWVRGGEALGQPATAAATPSGVPFWQVPAVPQAVVQGGAIPPGWQPQAVPYHGVGPDGKPVTMYVAPTYVFTYQSGPPVLGMPATTRGVNRSVPAATASGWNYATSGAPPASPAVPATTVTRYPPTAYQFPDNARALTGTPVVPPAGSPEPPPQQAWAAATSPTPATPVPAPAPPVVAPAPPPPAPSSGDWVTVVPPAVAAATLAGTATASPAPAVVAGPPSMAPVAGSVSAQPVSSGGLTAPPSTIAAPHLWRVVGVQDGDTLTCLDETNQQQRVRLAGIDAPEIGQDYGKESREALASMVFGKTVEVVDEGRDSSGRWIARLAVDGVDVSRQMVATGSAWNYASASSTDQSLAAVQSQAQAQGAGLWAAASPTPPWAYRQSAGGS